MDFILFFHVKKNYKNIRSLISFKFQDKKYSEEKYVKYALKKFGYNSKFSSINKKFFTSINRSVRIQEEPFSGLPVMSYENAFMKIKIIKCFLMDLVGWYCGYDKYKFSNKNLNKISQDGSFIGDIVSTDLEKNSSNYDYQLKKLFKDPLKILCTKTYFI